jgi:hypothetical protein
MNIITTQHLFLFQLHKGDFCEFKIHSTRKQKKIFEKIDWYCLQELIQKSDKIKKNELTVDEVNKYKNEISSKCDHQAGSLILKGPPYELKNWLTEVYFFFSFIFAIWFILTCWIWGYMMALFFSYPFLLVSLLFWDLGRRKEPNSKRFRLIKKMLIFGVIFSIIVLAVMLCLWTK